jgi:hypothetical protein
MKKVWNYKVVYLVESYNFRTNFCWGCPKIRMTPPNTSSRKVKTFMYTDDAEGDQESPRDCSHLKSCECFYTCPRTPFYREMKGLLHFENTPRTQGIFLVWTCTWMFFTSHKFTSLPLVHTPNPDFLRRRLWICFPLIRESPHPGNLHTSWLSNSNFGKFPNFADFRFRGFAGSWLRILTGLRPHGRFKISDLHEFTTPSFAGPGLRIFACSRFRSFTSSRFQILAGSRFLSFVGSRLLKTYFTNFIKLGVSRVTGFPEFPNTSPSGKRVDSDDPIPRKS